MKKMKYLLLTLVLMLMLAACGSKEENNDSELVEMTGESTEDTSEDSMDKAPGEESDEGASAENAEPVKLFGTFTSKTLEGEEVTDEIFAQADLTMVNIWGTFCGPCIAEMPDLGDISREYADKGFQIVGILCDVMEPGDETALEIVGETKADYTHLIASDDLTMNVLQYVSSVPTTAFIDKEGNVVGEVYAGSRSKTEWELIINQYLAEVK